MTASWGGIRLTPLDGADAARVNAWQNDPAVRDLTMGFRFPVAPETTIAWIGGLAQSGAPSRVVFAIRRDGALAGIVQLQGIDWVQRTAQLGITIGEPARRGAGLGFIASSLLLDYAFAGLDLVRVGLSVAASNARARRLYERLGFTAEGCLRAAYRAAGQRGDVALYGLLQAEWQPKLPANANRLVQAVA